MKKIIHIDRQYHLSTIESGDVSNLVLYLNDQAIYQNTLTIPFPYTERDARFYIANCEEKEKANGFNLNWGIRNQEGSLIGSIGNFLRTGVTGHKDEIGYWLGRPFWGQGIMTETVKVFSNYLFNTFPFARLEANIFAYNPASGKVLEKAGYIKEGYLRNSHMKDNRIQDGVLYAKIKE